MVEENFVKIKLVHINLHPFILAFLEIDWKTVNNFFLDAVKLGDVETVDQLLQYGMPVHVSDEVGWTAFRFAVTNNQTDIVKLLLKANTSP